MSRLYECGNCGEETHDADLNWIRDIQQRVEAGELFPRGECPECGALVDCPDDEIPEHTIAAIVSILRDRGYTIEEPKS